MSSGNRSDTVRAARARRQRDRRSTSARIGALLLRLKKSTRRRRDLVRVALAVLPALIALLTTAFVHVAPLNPDAKFVLLWLPGDVGIVGLLAFAGLSTLLYLWARSGHRALAEARKVEAQRRVIAAIGVAASWDLELSRLYRRVAQDLKGIIPFDRLTITAAQPNGQMRIEFVLGNKDEGVQAGELVAPDDSNPDGLFAGHSRKYPSRLTVPVAACNGTLTIRSHEPDLYDAAHLDLLRQAIAQISPGISNALMYRSTERQMRERTALAAIGRTANSESSLSAIFETVNHSLGQLISFDHMGVALIELEHGGQARLAYWSNSGLLGLTQGDSVHFDTTSISSSDIVTGRGRDPLGLSLKDHLGLDETRTWLQAPLVVRDRLIGIIVLTLPAGVEVSANESALVQAASLQVAPAIQNAILTTDLTRRAEERRAVAAVGLAANSQLDLEAIYERVADSLAETVPYDRLVISFTEHEDMAHEIRYVRGADIAGHRVGDMVMQRARADITRISGKPVAIYREDSGRLRSADLSAPAGLRSWVQVSLGTAASRVGFLSIHHSDPFKYDEGTVEFLERIADQIAPAIRNAQMLAAERELRAQLDKQNQELHEANNARKQFLSTVSHELKTPLTIISGFIDLIASAANLDEEQKETVGIIRRNADQLAVLINDILDISRIDAGTFKLNLEPFCVNELIDELEASFRSLIEQKRQRLVIGQPGGQVWINADRTRIRQLITNLMSNASKYSGEQTDIELSCTVEDDRLVLSVRDHGIGISAEDQQNLFTPFYRVDNETTRKVAGTGLGLVISKSIAELHSGELSMKSMQGVGTTMSFWLPGLTSSEQAAKDAENAQAAITGSRLWSDDELGDIQIGAD